MFKVALKLQKVCLFGSQRFDRNFVKKKYINIFSLIFQSGIVIEKKSIQRITTSSRKNADCIRLFMDLFRS